MNISNESLPKTHTDSSASPKRRALTFAYRVENGIYVNLTNRCTNDCAFCLRNNGYTAYGSDILWLEREPTPEEAADAVEKIFFPECAEFVFCGYGEPMCRAYALLDTARILKSRHANVPIRINTNGQADLILKEDIVPQMAGLIDTVSISLNTADATSYVNLCRPAFGTKAYDALLEFGRRCVEVIPNVIYSVVRETLTKDELCECERIVNDIGAVLRIRDYISD